ncbi:protein HAIKU1-like [Medicago truncatula]|uniref:protein HAIKU1-like n=1 Tax=Medicago truncatula TaxID=3880 RepID=UPI0000F6FE10|nr:protein HAIKU1-like [Medicago truncatula]
MEKSKKLNENLGVNKIGKTIKNNPFQQTNDFGNNIITSGGYPYSMPKDKFYNKNRPPPLSIVRPPVPVQATSYVAPPQPPYNAPPRHPLQPINDPHLVDSQNNLVESPISAFMRDFQDYMKNYDNSTRSNQFQSYPSQSQVLNNNNVQSQQQHYPMGNNNQLVNCFHTSQANGSNQLVNGFAPSQTYLSNPSVSLNATNPNIPMNVSSQLVTGFPSSQTTDPLSSTSEFLSPSPTNNLNLLSPPSVTL